MRSSHVHDMGQVFTLQCSALPGPAYYVTSDYTFTVIRSAGFLRHYYFFKQDPFYVHGHALIACCCNLINPLCVCSVDETWLTFSTTTMYKSPGHRPAAHSYSSNNKIFYKLYSFYPNAPYCYLTS